MIVAVSLNGVIGHENRLPWHIPEDLQRFKKLTMGHHLIMGRHTYQSLGRLLPGRTSVVITRDLSLVIPGAHVVHSLGEAVQVASADDEAFVIGGSSIFAEAVSATNRIYLTRVLIECEGDVHFDWNWLEEDWTRVSVGPTTISKKSRIPFRYEEFQKT